MIHRFSASLLAPALSLALSDPANAAPDQALARQLLDALIASNTAPSGGPDTRQAVGLLVEQLRAGGFAEEDITVIGVSDEQPSIAVRYRSPDPQAGAELMMAHMDVVEGLASDWTQPPRWNERAAIDRLFYIC